MADTVNSRSDHSVLPPLVRASDPLPDLAKLTSDRVVVGVDEVGRGPLAGDVVAAAVALDPDRSIAGLADSKTLSEEQREARAAEVEAFSRMWAIGRASPQEIDERMLNSRGDAERMDMCDKKDADGVWGRGGLRGGVGGEG